MQETRFLLYMDILGTKKLIENDSYESVSFMIKHFIENNREFYIDFKEVTNDPAIKYQFNGDPIQPTISSFSDHICASYPSYYRKPPFDTVSISTHFFILSLINLASQFHLIALKNNLLMRGAITEGKLLHEGNFILGKPLIDADELEKKAAVYPRVIITDNITEIMSKHGLDLKQYPIKKDFDGLYFIDYLKNKWLGFGDELTTKLSDLRNIIKQNLVKSTSIRQAAKWRWIAIKFDESLDYFHNKNNTKNSPLIKIEKFNLLGSQNIT